MRAETGLILRLTGMGIEAACAIAILSVRGRSLEFAGLPAETWLWGGLVVGIAVLAAGWVASLAIRGRVRDE